MLSVVSNEPVRLELGPPKSLRTYLLKVPALLERANWRHGIAQAGGRLHGQLALLDALRDGVIDVMRDSPEAIVGALLAKIEAHKDNLVALYRTALDADPARDEEARTALTAASDRLSDSGRGLAVMEMEILQSYPRYAAMVADDQTYWQIAGIEGARRFLVGWEGMDGPLRRVGNATAESSLACIPESDLDAIGRRLDELTRLTEPQRKNFLSPSSTP